MRIVSLGTTFYRSYYRHLDHTAPVHADNSVFDIFFGDKSLPPDAVDLVIKDVDGVLAQGRGEQVGRPTNSSTTRS